jgi:hypothetical protein
MGVPSQPSDAFFNEVTGALLGYRPISDEDVRRAISRAINRRSGLGR